jgi:hypothetical protein
MALACLVWPQLRVVLFEIDSKGGYGRGGGRAGGRGGNREGLGENGVGVGGGAFGGGQDGGQGGGGVAERATCLAKQLELRPFVLCLVGSVMMFATLWKVASMTGRVRNQRKSLFLVHRNGTRVIERSAHTLYTRKLSGLCVAAAEAEHSLVSESFDRRMKSMQLFVNTQTGPCTMFMHRVLALI